MGKHNLVNNILNQLIKILTYFYLYFFISLLSAFLTYELRFAVKPFGWLLMMSIVLLSYIVYILTNHIFLKKIVKSKYLLFFDILSLIIIISLCISEFLAKNHYSCKYWL